MAYKKRCTDDEVCDMMEHAAEVLHEHGLSPQRFEFRDWLMITKEFTRRAFWLRGRWNLFLSVKWLCWWCKANGFKRIGKDQ